VEATAVSNSLRDITIELEYHGVKDEVRATGIWAELTAVEHDNRSAASILADETWSGMIGRPNLAIQEFGGTGLIPPTSEDLFVNMILMQFTVFPTRDPQTDGTWESDGVFFDATRQVERQVLRRASDDPLDWFEDLDFRMRFPRAVELPNDDTDDFDESPTVQQDGHFYSVDGPALGGPPLPDEREVSYLLNAREWLRVGFGSNPQGNAVAGSRSSAYFDWHSIHTLAPIEGQRQRTTGDDPESNSNHIEPGHQPFWNW
jgi:hypothetical protein